MSLKTLQLAALRERNERDRALDAAVDYVLGRTVADDLAVAYRLRAMVNHAEWRALNLEYPLPRVKQQHIKALAERKELARRIDSALSSMFDDIMAQAEARLMGFERLDFTTEEAEKRLGDADHEH